MRGRLVEGGAVAHADSSRRRVARKPGSWGLSSEASGAYDVVPFGLKLEEFTEIAVTNFSRRMQRIERARNQTLDEVYELAGIDAGAGR
jgi:hypothetical protein